MLNIIKPYGFNLDFAPISDVNTNAKNPVIGSRAFSCDPNIASKMVKKTVGGFIDNGIICSLKHFSWHRDTTVGTLKGFAKTQKTLNEL